MNYAIEAILDRGSTVSILSEDEMENERDMASQWKFLVWS